MSIEDPTISIAWLAYYCGDNQMVERLVPKEEAVTDRNLVLAKKLENKEPELFGFDDEELVFELADRYWSLNEEKRPLDNSVFTSSHGLVRCVIWPYSEFRFEGRAYLTDLSVKVESAVAYHLLETKIKSRETRIERAAVPVYSGTWVHEADTFVAEVASCDFGLFRINGISTSNSRSDDFAQTFADNMRSLIDEVEPVTFEA